MLRDRYRIIVQTAWDGRAADAMIALHARRSALSIAAFHESSRRQGIAVVLTGTDLYRDLAASAQARASLDIAHRIVVLQDDAPRLLEERWRPKVRVVFQSARLLARGKKPRDRLDCVIVGHLRAEKDPQTLFRAIALLPADMAIRIRHIGAILDPQLHTVVRDLSRNDTRYRYSGALPHGLARAAIKAAHVLVHPSLMEGGANVVAEAVTAGTAVIASRISGNLGMLGYDYPGYFTTGSESELAGRLVQALEEPGYLRALERACARRKALFRPESEARAVRELVSGLTA